MDDNLAVDEAQKLARHEAVKQQVNREVQAEIAQEADKFNRQEQAQVAHVGQQIRGQAIDEVATTEVKLQRARGVARISQFIDYIFYLIYGIITLEIVLELFGARDSNAFKRFVDALSAPFLTPFKNLLVDPTAGRFQLRLSFFVALIVYILLHLAINGMLRLFVHKKTSV
ncbi:MAG: YggT family protein [Acidobacteria bacterium]|nr:YggT family protein [Acidobacteriota bacterium]